MIDGRILQKHLKDLEDRLSKYINKHNILHKHQYECRSFHSTYMAILQLIDKISLSINKKEFTAGIFINLCKALTPMITSQC